MNKRGNKKNSKGQMQISFGMVFSVILIIVFIAFAIYGIVKIFDIVNAAKIATFKEDFQQDINDMHSSTSGAQKVGPYFLPRKIKQVCFVNDEFENMYFVPSDFKGALLENVDIIKSLNRERKLCIDTPGGKISMTIEKDFKEDLVTIKK